MAFAIFYNSTDLQPLADAIQAAMSNASLTAGQRNAATRIWSNGLSSWAAAPVTSLQRQEGDADTREIVISSPQVALADFRALLFTLAKLPTSTLSGGRNPVYAIWDDTGRSSGAQEPWP